MRMQIYLLVQKSCLTPYARHKWLFDYRHHRGNLLIPVMTQLQIVMVLPFVLGLFYIKQKGDRTLRRVHLLGKASITSGGLLVIWSFLLVLYIFPSNIILELGQALFGLFVSLVVWTGIIRDYLRL